MRQTICLFDYIRIVLHVFPCSLILFSASVTHAACLSPTGGAGDIIFNSDHHVLQYCNDTDWVGVGGPNHDPRIGNLTANKFCGVTAAGTAIDCSFDVAGGTTPAPSNGYIQFNNNGAFGGDSSLFWNNTSKRLGIGTVSPAARLDVGGATPTLRLSNGGTAGIQMLDWSDNNQYLDFKGDLRLRNGIDGVGSNNPLTLTAAGNVGIGTANPSAKLDIAGGYIRTSSVVPGIVLEETDQSNDTWFFLADGTTLGIRHGSAGNFPGPFQITATGNVGIGTASPTQKIDVVGNAAISGNADIDGTALIGWERVSGSTAASSVATCSAGKQVTGGGCLMSSGGGWPGLWCIDIHGNYISASNYPSSATQWSCGCPSGISSSGGSTTAYAICARMGN